MGFGAYMVTLTGFTLLFCNLIYFRLLPARPLLIRLEQSVLMFNFGWSYWLVMVAGVLCVLMGGAVSIIDLIYPHKFSTILEVDFGTPFDRHTIIEDSQETKKKKKNLPKLEDPVEAMVPVEVIAQVEVQEDGAQVEAAVEVVVMEEGNGKDGLLILHAEEEVVEAMVEVAVEVMEAVGEVVEGVAEEFHSS